MELDTTNVGRSWWLVKVPNFVSDALDEKEHGDEIGSLEISRPVRPGGPSQIALNFVQLDQKKEKQKEKEKDKKKGVKRPAEDDPPIPREYKVQLEPEPKNCLAVFSEFFPAEAERKGALFHPREIALEGSVSQRGDAKPTALAAYLKLRKLRAAEAAKPKRQTVQVSNPVLTFQPIARHAEDMTGKAGKGQNLKRARKSREEVQAHLLKLFELHQYYTFKDLMTMTEQPESFLKEILRDIGYYHTKNPHKNMWELKKEYSHYENRPESDGEAQSPE